MPSLYAHIESTLASCARGREDLHDYQREAVDWLRERPFSALFVDVGLGKTVIIETLLDGLFERGFAGRVLIIAPIRVATRVWMREHRLWRHIAYFNPTLLRVDDADPRLQPKEGKTERKHQMLRELLRSPAPIHVINQEAVAWLVEELQRQRRSWPYPVVVFDESSRLRDHNSRVFKALQTVLPRIKRFHQLTATPASQTYMHLFSQIYLLDRGKRLGLFITHFRLKYFFHSPYDRSWTLQTGAAQQIEERISDICLVMRSDKNFVINIRRIDLPLPVMKQYKKFERDSILKLQDATIDAINGGALSNKLLQFASGAVYDENAVAHTVHEEKIDELKQLAEETLDNPVMVAYWYKSSLVRLRKAFPKAAIMDREGAIEAEWNAGKHKMMFVHPRSVAHGLNLQAGGHHIVLFDIFWPLELFTQLIGRLDRQGQKHTVMVHLLSATGTHDEIVAANLEHLRNAEQAMFRRLSTLQSKLRSR